MTLIGCDALVFVFSAPLGCSVPAVDHFVGVLRSLQQVAAGACCCGSEAREDRCELVSTPPMQEMRQGHR